MSARARHLAVMLAVLLAVATPLAVAAATMPGTPGYTVRSGDTITSIAVQLRLPGGWEQLYSANKDRIGPDPNRLTVGTELTVPQGAAVPAGQGYVVRPGDTLNSIAARLHVAGGGAALFEANRAAIGADPNRLEVGQTLLPPGAAVPPASTTQPAQQAQPKASAPPAQSLDRPAAPAPVAQAQGGATVASDSASGRGKTVLWSVLAAILFLLFVLLVLVGGSRRRRGGDVWVGGEYSRDHQPEPEAKRPLASLPKVVPLSKRVSQPKRPAEPEAPRHDDPVLAALRNAVPGRSARPERDVVDLDAADQGRDAGQGEGVRILPPTGLPPTGQPSTGQPSTGQPTTGQPPRRDLGATRTLERKPRPAALRSSPPAREQRPAAPQRDLTDELLGEVRLVDPSTPLTKDRH